MSAPERKFFIPCPGCNIEHGPIRGSDVHRFSCPNCEEGNGVPDYDAQGRVQWSDKRQAAVDMKGWAWNDRYLTDLQRAVAMRLAAIKIPNRR
jgi:hypothetical protein